MLEDQHRPIRRRLRGVNVPGAERAASAVAGAALAAIGLRRRGLLGGVLAGLGAALIARGVTGRSPTYRNRALRDGIVVRRSIIVQRSRREIYRVLRELKHTPRFMNHLVAVEETGPTSRWVAKVGPVELSWHARLVDELPDHRLSWRSLPGGDVTHEGAFDLDEAPGDRGTLVTVTLRFHPPGGALAWGWRGLLRAVTDNQLATDLIRMRQLLETGEIATGARRIDELDGAEREAVVPRTSNGRTSSLPPFAPPEEV